MLFYNKLIVRWFIIFYRHSQSLTKSSSQFFAKNCPLGRSTSAAGFIKIHLSALPTSQKNWKWVNFSICKKTFHFWFNNRNVTRGLLDQLKITRSGGFCTKALRNNSLSQRVWTSLFHENISLHSNKLLWWSCHSPDNL